MERKIDTTISNYDRMKLQIEDILKWAFVAILIGMIGVTMLRMWKTSIEYSVLREHGMIQAPLKAQAQETARPSE